MDEQLSMEQYMHMVEKEEQKQPQKEPVPDFNVGDTVKVVAKAKEAMDVETEGYLQLYEGKTGELVRINERSNPTCYEVDFGGSVRSVKNGLFYANQIKQV